MTSRSPCPDMIVQHAACVDEPSQLEQVMLALLAVLAVDGAARVLQVLLASCRRVSVPDFPSIVRSSLAEPNYGSFGFSMRDPPYECAPLTASPVISAAHTVVLDVAWCENCPFPDAGLLLSLDCWQARE